MPQPLQDKNVSKQSEIEVKCATEMLDGRLDMLKGDLIKDFKQEELEEEAGAGSFGILTNPGKPGTGGGPSDTNRPSTSAAAKRAARNRPAAGSDPRVIAARVRKDTVKLYTSGQVLLEKALQVGEEMLEKMVDLHGSEENAMGVEEFKTMKIRLKCLNLLKDDQRGHQSQDTGAKVAELLQQDPHFSTQNIKPDRVQTIGYMGFVRSTLLEICRTADMCNELGDKHKDWVWVVSC